MAQRTKAPAKTLTLKGELGFIRTDNRDGYKSLRAGDKVKVTWHEYLGSGSAYMREMGADWTTTITPELGNRIFKNWPSEWKDWRTEGNPTGTGRIILVDRGIEENPLFGFGKAKTSYSSKLMTGAYNAGYKGSNGHRGDALFNEWLSHQSEKDLDSGFVRRLRDEYKKGMNDFHNKQGGSSSHDLARSSPHTPFTTGKARTSTSDEMRERRRQEAREDRAQIRKERAEERAQVRKEKLEYRERLAALKAEKRAHGPAERVRKSEDLKSMGEEYKGRTIRRTQKGFEVLGETWTTMGQAKEYVDLYNITGGKVYRKTNSGRKGAEAKRFIMANPKRNSGLKPVPHIWDYSPAQLQKFANEQYPFGVSEEATQEWMRLRDEYYKAVGPRSGEEILKAGDKHGRNFVWKWVQEYRKSNPGPVESTLRSVTTTGKRVGQYLDRELGHVVGNPKTKLDLILDSIDRTGREVTFDVRDGYTAEQKKRLEDTARARGFNVSGDGKYILVRKIKSNPDGDLYDRIQAHLAEPDTVIAIRTHLKQTNYTGKHASLFIRPTKPGETGVYVKRGKQRDYVFPQYVHFGRWKTKSNPESSAASMYETFHGRPSQEEVIIERDLHYHENVAGLGTCCGFIVTLLSGYQCVIGLSGYEWQGKIPKPDEKWKPRVHGGFVKTDPNAEEVLLTSNEDGTQCFLDGGDQSLDVESLGITGHAAKKESIVLGDVSFVGYETEKDFDKFEPTQYVHSFSEDTRGPLPQLRYDRLNQSLHLDGGVYFIDRPLMGTSAGIED